MFEKTTSHQKSPDFELKNFCLKKILGITHKISSSFDENYKTRGVFFHITKTFNKLVINLKAAGSHGIY